MSRTDVSGTSVSPSDLKESETDLGEIDIESEESTAEDEDGPLSLDVIFGALKNQRRRLVIKYLKSADGPVELRNISEHIAAFENDKSVSELEYDERKRVYVALYQCHLPQLDDDGIVSFNQSRGEITLTDQAADLNRFLEDEAISRKWHLYYASIVVAGSALLGLSAVSGGLLFSSPSAVLVLVLVAVSVCAGCQAWFRNN